MLLRVCMKDYVARSYGHTPRKLPLKSVPLRATSRFIAYQAEIIILYLLQFVKKNFSIYEKKSVKISTKFTPCFCALSPIQNCTLPLPDLALLTPKILPQNPLYALYIIKGRVLTRTKHLPRPAKTQIFALFCLNFQQIVCFVYLALTIW